MLRYQTSLIFWGLSLKFKVLVFSSSSFLSKNAILKPLLYYNAIKMTTFYWVREYMKQLVHLFHLLPFCIIQSPNCVILNVMQHPYSFIKFLIFQIQ